MVLLVGLFETAQDGNGVLYRRLAHKHSLEATRQSLVLLDVLTVLVERGSTDRVQLSPCQRRLEDVACVHGTFGCSRTHDSVQLVDEQYDLTVRFLHFLEYALEPVLELTAILSSSHKSAHV